MDDWQQQRELYESNEKMRTVANVGTLAEHSNQLRAACVQTVMSQNLQKTLTGSEHFISGRRKQWLRVACMQAVKKWNL